MVMPFAGIHGKHWKRIVPTIGPPFFDKGERGILLCYSLRRLANWVAAHTWGQKPQVQVCFA